MNDLVTKFRNALAVWKFLNDELVTLRYWGGRELYINNEGRLDVYKDRKSGGFDVFYEGTDLTAALAALAGEE